MLQGTPYLRLVTNNERRAPDRWHEPIQSIHLKGVLDTWMSPEDIRFAAREAAEGAMVDTDNSDPTFKIAAHVLLQAGIIVDPRMLSESPTIGNTEAGRQAREITNAHLRALSRAAHFEMHDPVIPPVAIMDYQVNAVKIIQRHRGIPLLRITEALEDWPNVPGNDPFIVRRMLANTVHERLTRPKTPDIPKRK